MDWEYAESVAELANDIYDHHEYLFEENSPRDGQVRFLVVNASADNDEDVFVYEFEKKNLGPYPALNVDCIATTPNVVQVVLGMSLDYDVVGVLDRLVVFFDEELARRQMVFCDSDTCTDSGDSDDVDDDEEMDL
ncbi:unnamed protein product [Penicillium pancosmium]